MFQRKIISKWKSFCKTTSIHGLKYAFSKPGIPFLTKLVWKIIFISMLALCIYQSTLNIITYLSFNISMTELFLTTSNFDFPSITFSSMSMFKRNAIGNSSTVPLLLAGWYAENKLEMSELLAEVILN